VGADLIETVSPSLSRVARPGDLQPFEGGSMSVNSLYVKLALLMLLLSAASIFLGSEPWVPT